jgi:hypothetical protein
MVYLTSQIRSTCVKMVDNLFPVQSSMNFIVNSPQDHLPYWYVFHKVRKQLGCC